MSRAAMVALGIGAAIAAVACSKERARAVGVAAATDAGGKAAGTAGTEAADEGKTGTDATEAGAELAPLESAPPLVPLKVTGYLDAVVSVPLGARAARPVLVATHGLWDFPEGLCDNWRWIIGDRAWVLCPRGTAMPDKTYRYVSGPALASEIDAGVRALEERYPGYVDGSARVYTGFSLGAILGVWVVTHDPARYPRAVLIEGGEDKVTDATAAAYAHGGGKRVLFACGLRFRVEPATRAARRFERAGVPSRVVLGKLPDAGQFAHWYNGPVADEVKALLPWLVEGDARWDESPATRR